MNKRQLKFYWVVLHEWLDREQTQFPPDTVKELKQETKSMSDHLQNCQCRPIEVIVCDKTIPEIKKQAILLESNKHPDGGGFAFYRQYCFAIGETYPSELLNWEENDDLPAPDADDESDLTLMMNRIETPPMKGGRYGLATGKEYEIKVEELHVVEKTYFIEARTKSDAIKRARASDWDDALADEPTGEIRRAIIKSCVTFRTFNS